MHLITIIISVLLFVNTAAAIVTVLRRERDIAATWAWLLVLIFLPVLGFIFYLFAGRRLSSRRMQRIADEYVRGVKSYAQQRRRSNTQQAAMRQAMSPGMYALAHNFWTAAKTPLMLHNEAKLFTDGNAKFAALFGDIDAAQESICIEYYTIYPDAIGTELRNHLIAAAKRGVDVRVLYDAWGSLGMKESWWQDLRAVGGYVSIFFSSRHIITDFRLNYRDHRKIVVIDDQIAYTGGFNVGDQYLGRDPKFGNWRDTHMRLRGDVVAALKVRFVMDWNATVVGLMMDYPSLTPDNSDLPVAPMQVVASGPDTKRQHIKLGYTAFILAAERTVWIQTPYLVPDSTVLEALSTAAYSGVDVRVMVPNMPDHPFIFRATQYYANLLTARGVKIYHYDNGFMHAKTVTVDGEVASVGSANMDYRSFALNFEANTFIYDRSLAAQLGDLFEKDMLQSHLLTREDIAAQSAYLRFKQNFSRMLAPIL
ncbi:cardiolipin synthase [Lacticaseibacillus zhaodongensis]|uniref:cardiolipin synthase n=1 Tax=Lacticaseibacillus zhaodongensis TaxID=2668065 RepID=UPI0012D2C3DA|nr:cardiolipin synthase [Lacticaseibacillus zhaodongensis]